MLRASTSEAVDLGSISSPVKTITLKLIFTASLLEFKHERNRVENKPASLLITLLGKTLGGFSISKW